MANAELALEEIRTASKDVLVASFKSDKLDANEVNIADFAAWKFNGQPVTAINKFHAKVSGEAYRSGQMDAVQLSHVIQECSIKSIINLSGTDAPVLQPDEMETAKRLGVHHFKI